jgi:hypothetical protein
MLKTAIVLFLLMAGATLAQQPPAPAPGGPPPGALPGQPPPGGPPPGGPPGGFQPGQGPPGGFDGQAPPPWVIPRYRFMREDEDWSYLADPQMRGHDWMDRLKYIPLRKRDNWFLTLGGDMRQQYEYYRNENWGVLPFRPVDEDQTEAETNGYLSQRYMFHGDFHLGSHVRAFGQLKSGIVNWRAGGPRAIIDNDELDVNQAFIDVSLPLDKPNTPPITLRIGRQEMHFGSARLVSVREGPNVRAGFDGFRVIVNAKRWRIDNFAVKPVITLGRGVKWPLFPPNSDAKPARGYFDDRPDHEQTFWGTFATGPMPKAPFNVDAYYFRLKRKVGSFAQGLGPEDRHTLGGRIWKGGIPFMLGRGWDYDFEYAFQFGKFGPGPKLGRTFPFIQFPKGDIRAWTISSQTGYTFDKMKMQPRIGVNTGITTGDKDPRDPNLQTFFTPFPNGGFFGRIQQNGPLNIQGFRPNITLQLPRRASLTADTFFFWRQSLNDAMYNIPGFVIRPGEFSRSRYIGAQPGIDVFWPVTRHIMLDFSAAYFAAGQFLHENPPDKDLKYVTVLLFYRF